MKKIVATFLCICGIAMAGQDGKMTVAPPAPAPVDFYRAGEFDVGLSFTGLWTQTPYRNDRYFGVDHAFGGSATADYFITRNIGVGVHFSGYEVNKTVSGFIGDFGPRLTYRYPIGHTNIAPYAFGGVEVVFNGGNPTLHEPNCTAGCTLQFEKSEHNAKLLAPVGAGVEYRFSKNFGIFTEAAFDKIDRPQSNAWDVKAGVKVAF